MIGLPVADIVAFERRPPDTVVWRCNCGCISFELRANGDAVCVQCQHTVIGADGAWREKLPDVVRPVDPVGDDDVTITDLNSSAAALRRSLGKANADETAVLIIIQQDGAVTTWGSAIEDQAQSEWFDRRVETAKQMLTKKVGGPNE